MSRAHLELAWGVAALAAGVQQGDVIGVVGPRSKGSAGDDGDGRYLRGMGIVDYKSSPKRG